MNPLFHVTVLVFLIQAAYALYHIIHNTLSHDVMGSVSTDPVLAQLKLSIYSDFIYFLSHKRIILKLMTT